jgi:hypothetical protein
VFVGVEDVAAMPKNEVRDGSDQALLVGTADEENGAGSHGLSIVILQEHGKIGVARGFSVACALYLALACCANEFCRFG